MSLYEGSVKKPIMTSLIFAAIVVFGVFSATKLPVDLYPKMDTNVIMVMTTYSGASASDIENNVTRPLESVLNSVANLKHITSKSSENLSLITLKFEYGFDIDDLTNDVRDKLDMISSQLPDAVGTPIIFKFDSDMMPVLMLSVQADQSTNGLYKILDDGVANPLARIPGVGSVSIAGAAEREVYVYCDPVKLEAYNLSVEAISQKISAENMNFPGGTFDVGNESFPLRVEGEFKDPKDMENIVVASMGGSDIYLRDVAEVVDTIQERGQMAFNNGVRGAMIVVQKQSGANSVQISNKVLEELPKLQENLPTDVKIGLIANTSENIVNSINGLAETVFLAILFVVVVVFLFLGRWRATFVIGITIPISLVGSFIYLAVSDGSFNMISLACLTIAIGMVVDDAIVVLENVTTHIERGAEPKQAAIHATNEVAISVVASTLTMIAVFFPMTLVSGMAGMMFKQLGWMMCVILTVSTVSALTLTPMLCSQLLKLKKKHSTFYNVFYLPIQRQLDRLDVAYGKLIDRAVRHRKIVLFSCVALCVACFFAAKFVGTEFFPASDDSRLSVKVYMPVGTRTERTHAVASELADKWIKDFKGEARMVNYSVGQAAEDNTFAAMQDNGSHIASFNISLVRPGDRERTLFEISELIRADLNNLPEVEKFTVTAGGNSGMGGQSAVDFEIYGHDFDATDKIARELRDELLKTKGVSEVRISRSDYQPEIQVDFDREKLARHGLNLSTAATYLRNRINGSTASYYREDGDEHYIKVRYAPEYRTSIEDIENILIYTANGGAVRVKDVGTVVERFTPPSIERKDRERVNTVKAIVNAEVPMGDVVAAGNKIIKQMDIPLGINIQIAGSFEEQQESFADLGVLGVLIILLVFIVLAAQFESLTDPFIIITAVPMSIAGVILALAITGTNLNVMSLMGCIMLFGIVVKNGIVLIDYTKLCRERGMSAIQAAITAAKSRLRPVLMTTLTTILGMVPMAIDKGEGAEMWRPLGVSVIGGLVVSTLLTLILVPSLYCMFCAVGFQKSRRKHRKQLELDAYWEENKGSMIKSKRKRRKEQE